MLLAALLAGCGVLPVSATAAPAGTPGSTPVSFAVAPDPAEPTPKPEIVVFGAEASRSFQEGLADAAAQGTIAVSFVPGGMEALASYQPQGAVCAVVYWNEPGDALPVVGFPVFAYAAHGQTAAENIPLLVYDPSGTAESVLEEAISYPPHETPVRLIGLFASETSPGYTVWKEAAAKGRVFSKAEFFLKRFRTAGGERLVCRAAGRVLPRHDRRRVCRNRRAGDCGCSSAARGASETIWRCSLALRMRTPICRFPA